MKIHYHLSDYISHRRAGQAYMRCLRDLGHDLVDDPGESDLVILHEEPFLYKDTLAAMPPRPGRKHIGYAVWETPQLPRLFAEGVRWVDAVWTCSGFARQAFAPHTRTFVLPHVVERPKVSGADREWAVRRLGMPDARRDARDDFYFYAIIDTVNPRKDAQTLFSAFALAFPEPESRVKLVVKQYRQPLSLAHVPHVIDIPETLEDGRIAALHAVCDALVSPHHAEAWGLSLSEALSFGNPVIATGYSGNMDFMTAENSFPVPFSVVPVSENMCKALPNLFTQDMTWANVDVPELVRLLRHVRARGVSPEFRKRAAASMAAFSPSAICGRLRDLLACL